MGSYSNHILPTSTGLNLGSQTQQWNIFANLINGATPVNLSVVPIGWAANLTLSTQSIFTVCQTTLTGNVSSMTFAGVPGLVLFIWTQDAAGGRTVVWPANFNGSEAPDQSANSVSSQLFFYDGVNGWAITSQVVYP